MPNRSGKKPRNITVNGACLVLTVVGFALVSNRLLDIADVANEQGFSVEERKEKAKRNDAQYMSASFNDSASNTVADKRTAEPTPRISAVSASDLEKIGLAAGNATRVQGEGTGSTRTAQAGGLDISRMRPGEPAVTNRPRPVRIDSTPDYFGSLWGGFTPEQKFGAFVEAFWSFARQNTGSVDCPPIDSKGIKGCLAENGFRFESAYPSECKVTLTEFVPKPANVEATWDGKVVGKFAIARSLTIDLRSLNPALINNSLKLYFDLKNPAAGVERRVVLSTDAGHWQTIPVPPTLSDIPPASNDGDRMRAFRQTQMRWGQEVLQKYGSNHLPYFSFFDTLNTDPSVPAELRDANNLYYVLSPPNLMQPVQLFSANSAQNANALFVDALKSVIAKCPRQ